MPVAGIAQPQLEPRQGKRRRAAFLVQPLDLGVAHRDLILIEDPVGDPVVAPGVGEPDPRDIQRPGGIAPHAEPRPVDDQRVQPQPADEQRAPRHHVLHDRQHQRLAPFGIVDAHVDQVHLGPEPEPAGLDGADFHRGADGARCRGDDIAAVALDIGQDP